MKKNYTEPAIKTIIAVESEDMLAGSTVEIYQNEEVNSTSDLLSRQNSNNYWDEE